MTSTIVVLTKRLLRNDYRRLLLTFFSLVIASVVLTFVLSATSSLGTFLDSQTNALVGGDIEIDLPLSETVQLEPIATLQANGALVAEKLSSNVLVRTDSQVVLSSLNVVSENYPLYGQVQVTNGEYVTPDQNSILVQQNLLERLSVSVSDQVRIGEADYQISGVLVSLPDQLTNGFSFGPLVLLSQAGFARSGIDTNQSRLDYDSYVRIDSPGKDALLNQARSNLEQVGVRARFASDGAGRQLAVLDRVSDFLVVLAILSLFLVVVNIRANLISLIAHYSRTIALFKILGMSPLGVVAVFSLLVGVVALVAVITGVLIGNALLWFLLPYASIVINGTLIWPGLLSGIVLVCSAIIVLSMLGSLSGLYSIATLPAKNIFSEVSSGSNQSVLIRELLVGTAIALGLFLMVLVLSGSWLLALVSVGVLSVLYVVLVLSLLLVIKQLHRIRFRTSNSVRYVLNFIHARGSSGMSGFAALILALTALFSITGIEHSLQNDIRETVSQNSPNLYFLDVQPNQVETVREIAGTDTALFPNVRGRLRTIDGQAPPESIEGSGRFDRTFNLTYRENLLETETISQGTFHGTGIANGISVESETAEALGIALGSELVFDIQGRDVSGVVTSIRTLEESSIGIPFFYFVFAPDIIQNAPQTLFGYVYLEPEQIAPIQNRLADVLPNVSTIPTSDLIAYVTTLSELFSRVLSGMSLPAVLLGALLVYSQLIGLTATRIRDLSLFKLLGMARAKIRTLFFWETFILVFGCVVIAFVLSRIIIWLTLSSLFDLSYSIALEPGVLIIAILVGIGIVLFVWYFSRLLNTTSTRDLFFRN